MKAMNRSVQRLLSILLISMLVFSIIPVAVGAEEYGQESQASTVTESTYGYKQLHSVNSLTQSTIQEKAQESLEKVRAFYHQNPRHAGDYSSFFWELSALRGAEMKLSELTWSKAPWAADSIWKSGKQGAINLVTEYAGFIIGLLALDQDPEQFGSGVRQINLIEDLQTKQQSNGSFGSLYDHVWAMIALDAAGAEYNRVAAIEYLLNLQRDNGSFPGFDAGITGWVLIALSQYEEEAGVLEAINKALEFLKGIQTADAQFSDDANTLAAIISGLVAVGQDLSAWSKNNLTPIDALLQYQLADGSFTWKVSDPKYNGMATEQAMVALGDIAAQESVWKRLTPAPVPIYTKTAYLRVESHDQSIFPKQEVTVQTVGREPTALDVLQQALGEKVEVTGSYVKSINGISDGLFQGWDGWNYLVNGTYSTEHGPGDDVIANGDEVYFYYGSEKDLYEGWIDFEDLTLIPDIDLQPKAAVAGQDLQITITAKHDVYNQFFEKEATDRVAKIKDALIRFNNKVYPTNAEGIAVIKGDDLQAGTYTLSVSKEVKDSYPRLVRMERSVTITKQDNTQPGNGGGGGQPPKQEQLTFSVHGGESRGYIFEPRQVNWEAGDTPYTVLVRNVNGVRASGSGESVYVQEIAGLAEFDHGPLSGWMYAVNGNYPEQSAGAYRLQPSDQVEWKYTTKLGEDIGGGSAGGGGGGGGALPSTVLTHYTSIVEATNKLDLAANNQKPVQEVGQTVVIFNQDKKMSKEEAERLWAQLQQRFISIEQAISLIRGGSLKDDQGEVELIVPTQAGERTLIFHVQKLANDSYPAAISGVYELSPAGTAFSKPIVIVIKTPLLVDDLDNLALAWWNEQTKQWIPIPATVDAQTGLVSGLVDHFTKFAVIDKSKIAVEIVQEPVRDSEPEAGAEVEVGLYGDYIDTVEISPWALGAVHKAREYGLMQGVSNKELRFEPQRPITRAEFAALLIKLTKDNSSAQQVTPFLDVEQDQWYFRAVSRATENGWIRGVTKERFYPNHSITREEVAVMLGRLLNFERQIAEEALQDLKDAEDISAWALPLVSQLYQHQVMVGDQGKFEPKEYVSREMAAVLLVRMYERKIQELKKS